MTELFQSADMAEIPRTPETRKWLSFSEGTTLLKLTVDGAARAFGGYYVKAGTFWIGSDYVPPEFRGQGFHRRLLEARIAIGRATGCTQARARCNRLSLPNYLRQGFVVLSETKHRALVELRFS